MSFEINGKIIEIYDTIQVSDKFKKREFVLEKTEQGSTNVFTDYIKFQCTQDRCSIVDGFKKGDDVTVSFRIKGNKWEKEGKVNYFTNLDAWRVTRSASSASKDSFAASVENAPLPVSNEGVADDLPF